MNHGTPLVTHSMVMMGAHIQHERGPCPNLGCPRLSSGPLLPLWRGGSPNGGLNPRSAKCWHDGARPRRAPPHATASSWGAVVAGHRHCCLADRRRHETVNGRGGPTWGVGAGPAPPSGGGNGRVGGSSLLVACWRGARERAPRARSSVGAHIVALWAGQATQRDPGLLLSPPGQCRR